MRPRTRRKMASDTPEQTTDPIAAAIDELVALNDINDHISMRVILARLTAVGEGGIECVPLDELYGRTQTTETTDRPLRDIHVSALIAAALLFQGMESGPGDVILQEALDALIDAKRD